MKKPFQQLIAIMNQGETGIVIFLPAVGAKISVLATGTELKIAVSTFVLLYLFSGHKPLFNKNFYLIPADKDLKDNAGSNMFKSGNRIISVNIINGIKIILNEFD